MIAIVGAWRVVTSENIVRAALALVVVLAAMAPLFLLLAAELVAIVQVLVYVGAVVILFLFGIMLTRSPMERSGDYDNRRRFSGVVVAVILFAALWYAITDAFGNDVTDPSTIGRTAQVGDVLLRQNVIAFEAISVLLLAALVGAIALARRE